MRCPYPCSYALETSGHRCNPVPSAPCPPCTLSRFFPISCTPHGREWGAHGSQCRVGPLLYLALLRSTGSKGQLQGRCRVKSGKGGQWLVLLECLAPWMTAHRWHVCLHLLRSSHHKVAGWFSPRTPSSILQAAPPPCTWGPECIQTALCVCFPISRENGPLSSRVHPSAWGHWLPESWETYRLRFPGLVRQVCCLWGLASTAPGPLLGPRQGPPSTWCGVCRPLSPGEEVAPHSDAKPSAQARILLPAARWCCALRMALNPPTNTSPFKVTAYVSPAGTRRSSSWNPRVQGAAALLAYTPQSIPSQIPGSCPSSRESCRQRALAPVEDVGIASLRPVFQQVHGNIYGGGGMGVGVSWKSQDQCRDGELPGCARRGCGGGGICPEHLEKHYMSDPRMAEHNQYSGGPANPCPRAGGVGGGEWGLAGVERTPQGGARPRLEAAVAHIQSGRRPSVQDITEAEGGQVAADPTDLRQDTPKAGESGFVTGGSCGGTEGSGGRGSMRAWRWVLEGQRGHLPEVQVMPRGDDSDEGSSISQLWARPRMG